MRGASRKLHQAVSIDTCHSTVGKYSCTKMYRVVFIIISLMWTATRQSQAASFYPAQHHRATIEQNLTESLIKMTQGSLLRAFGHDMKRKPSRSFTPHEYMMYVYTKLSTASPGQSSINTVRGVVDTDAGKEALFRLPHQMFHFDVSGIPATEDLVGSEFRLLWKPSNFFTRYRRQRSFRRSKFYKVILLGVSPRTVLSRNTSTSLKIYRLATHVFNLNDRREKWIAFDELLRFTRRLRDFKVNVMKLALYVVELNNGKIVAPSEVGFDKIGRKEKEKGLLVLYSDDKTKKRDEEESSKGRAKRGARRGRKKDRKNSGRRRNKALCRRRKMYVNFDDFGWTNWIIAPKGYDAYYCRGSCAFPIPGHLSPTSHAVIQSTINSMDSRFIEPACCVPGKLKSIAMLYLDHNDRVVYQKREDMVVVNCACR